MHHVCCPVPACSCTRQPIQTGTDSVAVNCVSPVRSMSLTCKQLPCRATAEHGMLLPKQLTAGRHMTGGSTTTSQQQATNKQQTNNKQQTPERLTQQPITETVNNVSHSDPPCLQHSARQCPQANKPASNRSNNQANNRQTDNRVPGHLSPHGVRGSLSQRAQRPGGHDSLSTGGQEERDFGRLYALGL